MADEDNFDIDIYGDEAGNDYQQDGTTTVSASASAANDKKPEPPKQEPVPSTTTTTTTTTATAPSAPTSSISSTNPPSSIPAKPAQQSLKRKEPSDDRQSDPNASSSLILSDLNWWVSEDLIRSWALATECEKDIVEITFHEYKANGRSNG